MKTFKVEVTRISYAQRIIEVLAENEDSAKEQADEICGDFEYSEHSCDYEFDVLKD